MAARNSLPPASDQQNMGNSMDILVFRTNIFSAQTAHPVAKRLDHHQSVARWTIDYGDRDKVLRVEAEGTDPAEITELVASVGFECEELL